jgi:hypothetical protein
MFFGARHCIRKKFFILETQLPQVMTELILESISLDDSQHSTLYLSVKTENICCVKGKGREPSEKLANTQL